MPAADERPKVRAEPGAPAPDPDGAQARPAADRRPQVSRRALLAGGGLAAVAGGGAATAVALQGGRAATAAAVVPFRGHHQAGILTPRQQHVRLAAFDFGARTDRGRAAALLLRWTSAAEHLTRGEAVPAALEPPGSRAARPEPWPVPPRPGSPSLSASARPSSTAPA